MFLHQVATVNSEAETHVTAVQVLRYIAERMHLRHPNLVTVMGVSAEPITNDPLLVPRPGASCLLPPLLCNASP